MKGLHLANPKASSVCNGMLYSGRPLVDIRLYNIHQDCTTFVWEVLNVHDNELRLFMGPGIPPTLTFFMSHTWWPDIVALGTIFKVLSYDAVSGRNSNLSPFRRRTDALRGLCEMVKKHQKSKEKSFLTHYIQSNIHTDSYRLREGNHWIF